MAIALALVLVGTAGVLLSPVVEPPSSARVMGSDRPVNPGATDLGDISANNSPTIARNPRDPANLAVANRIDSPDFSCALNVSFDRGARWRRTRVPIPAGEGPKCYAPDVTFSADGALHLSYVTLKGVGNVPDSVWTASSRDGGRTLSRPRRVAGPLAFQVRISADPGNPERLYLTWLQARDVGTLKFPRPGNPIVAARSEDGGRRGRGRARSATRRANGCSRRHRRRVRTVSCTSCSSTWAATASITRVPTRGWEARPIPAASSWSSHGRSTQGARGRSRWSKTA